MLAWCVVLVWSECVCFVLAHTSIDWSAVFVWSECLYFVLAHTFIDLVCLYLLSLGSAKVDLVCLYLLSFGLQIFCFVSPKVDTTAVFVRSACNIKCWLTWSRFIIVFVIVSTLCIVLHSLFWVCEFLFCINISKPFHFC